MYIENERLKCEIWRTKTEKTYKINVVKLRTIVPEKKVIYTSDLSPGKRKILSGKNGYELKVIRDTVVNGKKVSSEVISEDSYRSVPGVVMIGK